MSIGWIGFGEAGATFAAGAALPGVAYDIRDDGDMRRTMEAVGVGRAGSMEEVADGASLLLSLVSADQAMVVAEAVAGLRLDGTIFCDMNSVSPGTKRRAAEAVTRAGGRYVDVAIMAAARESRLPSFAPFSRLRGQEAMPRRHANSAPANRRFIGRYAICRLPLAATWSSGGDGALR